MNYGGRSKRVLALLAPYIRDMDHSLRRMGDVLLLTG